MDTARFIRITNLCMLFFRAEGIAFSLYDKQDTCHLQYPEEPTETRNPTVWQARDPARMLDICTTPAMPAMLPSGSTAAGGSLSALST